MVTRLEHMLWCISKFDIQSTLPELQHEFCALWNQITQEARNRGGVIVIPYHVLRPIRRLYIALHQGTHAAPTAFDTSTDDDDFILFQSSSYPLCNIRSHLSESNSATNDNTHLHTTISPAHPPSDTVSPFPALTVDHSRVHLAEELSPHDVAGAPQTVESFRRSPPVNVESSHTARTSLDPLITQDTTHTLTTISPTSNPESDPHPALAMSTFNFHPSFATDPGVVPDTPLSSSPALVSSNTPPANLSSASSASQIDRVMDASGMRPSTSATTISSTPLQTSVSYRNPTSNEINI